MMGLKEAYLEKADAQLQEWQERIEIVKAGTGTTQRLSRGNAPHSIERLDDCCRIARIRLDELRGARDDRWEFAKQAVERAMIDLKRALDESGVQHESSMVHLQTSREHVYEPFLTRRG